MRSGVAASWDQGAESHSMKPPSYAVTHHAATAGNAISWTGRQLSQLYKGEPLKSRVGSTLEQAYVYINDARAQRTHCATNSRSVQPERRQLSSVQSCGWRPWTVRRSIAAFVAARAMDR